MNAYKAINNAHEEIRDEYRRILLRYDTHRALCSGPIVGHIGNVDVYKTAKGLYLVDRDYFTKSQFIR